MNSSLRLAVVLLLLTSNVYAMGDRVLVIGLDGATLETLVPWMEEGKLPNIKRLADKGVVGNLTSVTPYVSPVAWASFMTGNQPGKHGVYGFQQVRPGEYRPYIPMGRDVKGKTLWRILSDNGKKVVVVNVLMTYPIEDNIDGVIIGGMYSPGISAKPKEYEEWLKKEGYVVEGKGFMNTEKDEFLKDLYMTTDKRIDVSLKLMDKVEDWDFFMILVEGTDRIQHYLWGDMLDDHPKYGDAIEKYYIHVDEKIGEMIDKAGDDATVIIMSDHGFGRQKKRVHINHWLIENGFTHTADTWENKKTRWTIRISGFLKETGISEIIRGVLIRFFSGKSADIQPPRVEFDFSEKTSVFATAYYTGNLYMNPKLPPQMYEAKRDELIEKLKTLKDPETGEKIIKDIYKREEIYHGDYVYLAPDVIIEPEDGYWIYGGFNYYRLIEPVYRDTGQHKIDGAIIMAGPKIEKREDIIEAQLIDVAPTVLNLFSIESDMDGKPIKEALKK
jgi:predicted AlkP superfamily phosphohydrolase/phosphomutase